MKVLLISMPFGALERQALGLSLLKACLTRAGVESEIRYFNFDFAGLTGVDDYCWVNYQVPYTAFAGDWCFTEQLYGECPQAGAEYIDQILRQQWALPEMDIRRLLRIRALTGTFLDHCVESIDWARYDVVGFTSTFEQNIASLALSKRIKQLHPRIKIVFGGANWEGEMGLELHRQFAFVDYVCSGESEQSFPSLITGIRRNRAPGDVPGVVYRKGRESIATGPGNLVNDLDELPVPDYTDYFRTLGVSGANAEVLPVLLFETSRGCWWGARSHCTFCGLNGGAMAFRSKSPRRALDELKQLTDDWHVTMVEAVDNILDMAYFQEFLPAVAAEQLGLQLFYEVKANLSRRHLKQMAAAGVHRIQPGIESLSDHVLKLMRKGTTALQNVQLLKWCREYSVTAEWNLLYGFPGETRADYREILNMLPSIRFIDPPCACGPLRLDRFSPYFDHPGQFGIRNVRALRSYRHLYPFSEQTLRRIAYYFDFEYSPETDPRGFAEDVIRYAEEWRRNPEKGTLIALRRADGKLVLEDTRACATVRNVVLSGLEQTIYEFCDRAHAVAAIARRLRQRFPDTAFEEVNLRAFLDSAAAGHLMARQGDRYLSLALATGELRSILEQAQEEKPSALPKTLASV